MNWIIFGIIFSLIVSVIMVTYNQYNKRENRGKAINSVLVFILPVLIMGFSFIIGCIKNVGAAEVGVVYAPFNGGIQKQTLGEGMHFTNPFNSVYTIRTTQQQLKFEPFSVQTLDSEWANFIVEIKYRVPKENAYKVYNEYRGMPSTANLQVDVQSSVKQFAIEYNIYDILGGGGFEQLRTEALTDMQEKLMQYGIQLIELNFIDIDAGEQIEQAIVDKGIVKQRKEQAEQEKLVAQIEQETKVIEAETAKQEAIKQAEAQAETMSIEAQANADKIKLEAEAQAEAIRLIQEQLSQDPNYINYLIASGWNGELPDVVAGTDSNLFLNVLTGNTTDSTTTDTGVNP